VAQPGEDPALDDLHRDLDLGLVARVGGPRGHDHGAVVLGQLRVGALQPGLIAARDDHAALELVADDRGRDAADEGEDALMAGDPVRDLLSARGLGVGVVRRVEDGDEEFDLDALALGGIDDGRLLPGVVDESFAPAWWTWRIVRPRRPSQRR
jgi:hypothetical protein